MHHTTPCLPHLLFICLTGLFLPVLNSGCSDSQSTQPTQDELLDSAIDSLKFYDFDHAYKVLSELQPSMTPTDANWALATYTFGVSAWLKTPASASDINQATALLREVVAQAPTSSYAACALLDLGRINEIANYRGDNRDVDTARNYYEQVRTEFPHTDMSIRATLFLAQTYAQSLDPEQIHQAIFLLEECLQQPGSQEWNGVIGQYVGELYEFYLNEPLLALEPMERAARSGFSTPSLGDAILWRIGTLAEKAGRNQLAIEIYTRIIDEFPRTVYRSVSQQRIDAIMTNHTSSDPTLIQ